MLKVGKLDSDLLKKIVFDKITYRRPEVKVRPGIGEDCAVVDFGDCDCVMSTDPITAAVNEIGRLAIHITCNDIASNGVEPVGIMLAAMLPLGTTEDDIENIMGQAGESAASLGVEIIGGHTEITQAVNKPVIVSTAIGRSDRKVSNSADDMREGDVILLTKRAGLEGAGIIASDFENDLEGYLSKDDIAHAKSFLKEVSVVKEGVAAGRVGTHGMHDVTEGGILGAIWEMCTISKLGCVVYADDIPVDSVTVRISDYYDIDCLRLISSGCMLIIAEEDKKEEVMKAISDEGVDVMEIGFITSKEDGILLAEGGEVWEIEPPASDELYKVV